MKVKLVVVGKLKESYLREACAEYLKRLGAFSNISVVEVADEKTPDNASPLMEEKIKDVEGKRILSKITDKSYVYALAIEGKSLDSVELSEKLSRDIVSGISDITFVIGGSLGLSDAVLKRANYHLSFSKLTFPHQLMRVMLLEQIYRAFKIRAGEPYHK